ncbi:MAG TPA: hypothetical protein VNN18_05315 [Candidatus Xenobia bacterium]|nr:hypothetical protein [Candidatus Xenobia bacterium]
MEAALLLRLTDEAKVWVWLFFVGVAVAVVLLNLYAGKRRRQGLERAGLEMGFVFDAEAATVAGQAFLSLPLLSRHSKLSNVLRGAVGSGEAVLLDVRVGSGKQARTQTVACFRLAGQRLPRFELSPESFIVRIATKLGMKDIDFEASPEFSRSYLLRGADEAAVRAVFHPGLLMFFEQHTGWCVEGEGEWLAVYHDMQTVPPAKLRTFLEETSQVATGFL